MKIDIIIIGLCAVSMMGCSTGDSAHRKDEDGHQLNHKINENLPRLKAEWEQQFAAWKALDIQNYQFVYKIWDVGIHQKITVKDGVCESAINVFINESGPPHYETIDAIFDSINGSFFTEENFDYPPGQTGTSFSINYDPRYHYPAWYSKVVIFDEKYGNGYGGNGSTIEITEFAILED